MSRFVLAVLVSSVVGATLATLLAGWIYPCLGAAYWERCVSGTESNPDTFALPLCQLGVCDVSLSWGQRLTRVLVAIALVAATAAAAWYFSRSRRTVAAGAAVALSLAFIMALLPYAYPHG